MNKQALIELRDKVAANAEKYVVVNQAIDALEGGFPRLEFSAILANFQKAYFDDSLDAAVAFLEAVLPDWWALIGTSGHVDIGPNKDAIKNDNGLVTLADTFSAQSDTPARALFLATLDALIERAE